MNDDEEERNYIEDATPGIINHNLLAFKNTYHCRPSSSILLAYRLVASFAIYRHPLESYEERGAGAGVRNGYPLLLNLFPVELSSILHTDLFRSLNYVHKLFENLISHM